MSFNIYPKGETKSHTQLLDLPIIETPLTRVTETWFTFQRGLCKDLEIDYARCASRVGIQKAETDCKKFLDDLHECAYGKKMRERYEIMQAERKRQGKPFLKAPPGDSTLIWAE